MCGAQVISLGVHVVHDAFPGAMLLMEVMPSLLARRSFPRPATERCLEPGFRDSPDPSAVALVFIRVRLCLPTSVSKDLCSLSPHALPAPLDWSHHCCSAGSRAREGKKCVQSSRSYCSEEAIVASHGMQCVLQRRRRGSYHSLCSKCLDVVGRSISQ